MTAVDAGGDLVPLRTDFDVVWRGYDPGQVRHYVDHVEADLRLVTADRDAAEARAEDLARRLAEARSEIRELRARVDRISRTPVPPDALTERLRRLVELAHEEAAEITTRARAAAEQHWATAEQAATRLRERSERLVADLDARRREAEAEHRELMRQAYARIDATTRQAEQRRRELDEQAAALRDQERADFELAMRTRRAEAMTGLAEREAAAHARAAAIVRAAEERAERIVTDARRQVDDLRARRDRIAAGLHTAQRLLTEAGPLLHPVPEEIPAQRTSAVA